MYFKECNHGESRKNRKYKTSLRKKKVFVNYIGDGNNMNNTRFAFYYSFSNLLILNII